jgi:hypothetical protein
MKKQILVKGTKFNLLMYVAFVDHDKVATLTVIWYPSIRNFHPASKNFKVNISLL